MQAGQNRPCTQRKRRVRTGLSSANADSFLVGNRRACLCQERCCRVFLQRQVVVGHIVPYLSAVAVVLPIIVVEVEGIGGLDDFVFGLPCKLSFLCPSVGSRNFHNSNIRCYPLLLFWGVSFKNVSPVSTISLGHSVFMTQVKPFSTIK